MAYKAQAFKRKHWPTISRLSRTRKYSFIFDFSERKKEIFVALKDIFDIYFD